MELKSEMNGVIYARFSSAGQREESIEGQLRECHDFADRYGITVIGEYCDRAISGTTDRRPEFQRMIKDSEKGRFQCLIVWKSDRFARNRYDSAIYKAKLKKNGVRIFYARESIPDGPEGIILESVMEGYAEYYSANLSQNVKRGIYDSAMNRKAIGGIQLLGLRRGADGRHEPDPETAPLVRRIFEEYASGKSAKDIVDDLNREGYRTSRGNPFNKSSIRRIIQNEKYIGVYRYQDIYDPHGIPAIVSEELFARANKLVEVHHRAPNAKRIEGGFLLTTKLFCGECGEPMTGDSGTGAHGQTYLYYTCNGRRRKKCKKRRARKEWIEDLVVRTLCELVQTDEVIEQFADAYMGWQEAERGPDMLEVYEERLSGVEKGLKNCLDMIEKGLASDALVERLLQLESEKKDLQAMIAEARAEAKIPEITRDQVVFFLQSFRGGDQSDPGWRAYLVDTFLRAAYLYDDGRLLLNVNIGKEGRKITKRLTEEAVVKGSCFAPSGVVCGAKANFGAYYHDEMVVLRAMDILKKVHAGRN